MDTVASEHAARGEALRKVLGGVKKAVLFALALAWVGIGVGAAVMLVIYLS